MAESILENDKFKQLISRLNAQYDMTGEDIADVIWLGLKQQEYSAKTPKEELYDGSIADFGYYFYLLAIATLHDQYFRLLAFYV